MRSLGTAFTAPLPLTSSQQPCCHTLPHTAHAPARRPLLLSSGLGSSSSSCNSSGCSSWQNRNRGRRRHSALVVRADYYDTLGVAKSADKKAIKSAYRCSSQQAPIAVQERAVMAGIVSIALCCLWHLVSTAVQLWLSVSRTRLRT